MLKCHYANLFPLSYISVYRLGQYKRELGKYKPSSIIKYNAACLIVIAMHYDFLGLFISNCVIFFALMHKNSPHMKDIMRVQSAIHDPKLLHIKVNEICIVLSKFFQFKFQKLTIIAEVFYDCFS